MVFNPGFPNSHSEDRSVNQLLEYLHQQHPDALAQVAQSASAEVKEIITQNVQGLVGVLPPDDFSVEITTNREHLANLLGSAMMTGYFLRKMEQRMELETSLANIASLDNNPF